MKVNQWTLGLAAAGVISFGAVAQADEKPSQQVMTLVSSTTLSGYVSTTASWKPGTEAPRSASDRFKVDAVNLAVSKPLDEAQWSAGYTAELILGGDSSGFGGTAGNGGVGIKQAYVALNAPIGNGVALKMGIWDTIIGYEGYNYTANPNYSRSIGYGIEPTTYTGLQASCSQPDGWRRQ